MSVVGMGFVDFTHVALLRVVWALIARHSGYILHFNARQEMKQVAGWYLTA